MEGKALLGADRPELGPELFGVFAGHKAPRHWVDVTGFRFHAARLVTHCEVTQRDSPASSRMVHTDASTAAVADYAKGVIWGVVPACYRGWRKSDVL